MSDRSLKDIRIDWFEWAIFLLMNVSFTCLSIAAYGEGSRSGMFVGFLGMLWFCILYKDYRDVHHDLMRAIDGWSEVVNLLEEECNKPQT